MTVARERPRRGGAEVMMVSRIAARAGKVRTGVLLWALGVPLPLILLFVLLRGCV
jgi:hypothetical protein